MALDEANRGGGRFTGVNEVVKRKERKRLVKRVSRMQTVVYQVCMENDVAGTQSFTWKNHNWNLKVLSMVWKRGKAEGSS